MIEMTKKDAMNFLKNLTKIEKVIFLKIKLLMELKKWNQILIYFLNLMQAVSMLLNKLVNLMITRILNLSETNN